MQEAIGNLPSKEAKNFRQLLVTTPTIQNTQR